MALGWQLWSLSLHPLEEAQSPRDLSSFRVLAHAILASSSLNWNLPFILSCLLPCLGCLVKKSRRLQELLELSGTQGAYFFVEDIRYEDSTVC